jgi:hypothetical protein
VILTIRVWAVWGQDRRLTIGLPIFFAMCFVPCIVIMGFFLQSTRCDSTLLVHCLTFSHSSLQTRIVIVIQLPHFRQCRYSASWILFINWVLLMVYDLGVFLPCLVHMIPDIHNPDKSGTCTLMIIAGIQSCNPHSLRCKSHTFNSLDNR